MHVANLGNGLRRNPDRLKPVFAGMPLRVSGDSVVVEQYAAPAIYHFCMRFVRMYKSPRLNEVPVIMLDADVLVRKESVALVRLVFNFDEDSDNEHARASVP